MSLSDEMDNNLDDYDKKMTIIMDQQDALVVPQMTRI